MDGDQAIERRIFMALVSGGLLAAPLAAGAQQAKKVYRIGYLEAGSSRTRGERFLQGLHDLGYIEGRDFVMEYRWAEGHAGRLPELAADLVRARCRCDRHGWHTGDRGRETGDPDHPNRFCDHRVPGGKGNRKEPGAAWRERDRSHVTDNKDWQVAPIAEGRCSHRNPGGLPLTMSPFVPRPNSANARARPFGSLRATSCTSIFSGCASARRRSSTPGPLTSGSYS